MKTKRNSTAKNFLQGMVKGMLIMAAGIVLYVAIDSVYIDIKHAVADALQEQTDNKPSPINKTDLKQNL